MLRHRMPNTLALRTLLVPIAVAAVLLVIGRGSNGGTLRAAFESAVNVVPGQEVRIAGRKVGEVASVSSFGGQAIVDLKVGSGAWPLHRGTTARLRYGSTIGYASRYVELHPGPRSAPVFRDGGVLTSASTTTPVEFDQLLDTYDRPTRRNLRGFISNLGETIDGHGDDLGRGITSGSEALDRLDGLVRELGADRAALATLFRSGARTAGALRSEKPALQRLLGSAAATFDELSSHTRAQQAMLDRFPAALHDGRRGLGRLDRSLVGLRALVHRLRPGARGLRTVARPLRRTLEAVHDVAPVAAATFRQGRRTAPLLDRLLQVGAPFLPRVASVLAQLAPMVSCLRPYAPEIGGASASLRTVSGLDDPLGLDTPTTRVDNSLLPAQATAGSRLTSAQIVDLYKGRIFYAMPRPPGLNAGQPWLLPECGVGRDALDPSKDPETQTTGGGK